MPIIHFANSKNQNTGGLKKLLGYVSKEKKTKLEDRRLVSGVNCSTENAYNEMMLTKQMHKKTGGRLYYHLVQSFPKGYEISPELAHQIALEFTESVQGLRMRGGNSHRQRAYSLTHCVQLGEL